ncbi:MAG: MBL fold metallo-hydrolase [Lachnospiraceae bacterium]|jgi:glyoxylase-like metal-dependent hydrolase (beta-lactamase superfamily II)|nr:MBL fold metallo-hydrolase [Lachnospiraceae bacterium]
MAIEVKQINEDIYTIEDGIVRAFVINGENKTALIDAGITGGKEFKDAVLSISKNPVVTLITHADFDHIAGVPEFGVPYIHPSEMAHYGMEIAKVDNKNFPIEVNSMWDGEFVDIGGYKLESVLLPGHTPGSVGFIDREHKIMFIGDTVSMSIVFMNGFQRNYFALEATLKKLQKMAEAGKFNILYSAHGEAAVKISQIGVELEGIEKLIKGELKEQPIPPYLQMKNGKLYTYKTAMFLTE